MRRHKNNSGYTLIELLVASMISIFVFSSVISTYVMIQKFWRGGSTQIELQRDARIAMDKIVRKVRSGLEATVLNSGDTLQLRLDPNKTETQTDDIWCQYDFGENKITFTPDISAPATYTVILNNVYTDNARPIFAVNGKNVTIVFGAKNAPGQVGYKASYMESSGTLRNG